MLPFRVIVLIAMASLVGENLFAQSRWDCLGAIPICGNDTISIISGASEYDDFSNPNNDRGCITTGEGSHSTWVYFEFREDMPLNSKLEMTLFPPDPSVGWAFEDFDFAIYGPDLNCDSLGSPRRCSYARSLCTFCPYTGMGRGALESQEDAFVHPITGIEVDGYVLPLEVVPGGRYYMLVTKFTGFSTEFAVEWGGEAAAYFNCLPDPACVNLVNAGPDLTYCKSDTFSVRLDARLRTNSPEELTIEWSGTPEAMTLLDSANILKPKVSVPAGFEGSLEYEIRVLQGLCDRTDKVKITVLGSPEPVVTQAEMVCLGESTTLAVQDIYESYLWSNGTTGTSIDAITGQVYSLTVTNASHCAGTVEYTVASFPNSIAKIVEGPVICGDQPTTLRLEDTFVSYEWSDGSTNPTLETTTAGIFSVTVTDANLCVTADTLEVVGFAAPIVSLSEQREACAGEAILLGITEQYPEYRWSNGATTSTISVTQTGIYALSVTDENGCQASASATLTFRDLPAPRIEGDTNLCESTTTILQLIDSNNYESINWSNTATTPAINVNTGGNYSVTVSDDLGCIGSTSITIVERELPILDIEETAFFCPGTSVVLAAGAGHASYLWSTGETSPNIVVWQAGDIGISVSNEFGCTDSGVFEVSERPTTPPVIQGPGGLCFDEEGTLAVNNALYQSYQWSTHPDDTLPNIDIQTGIEAYRITVVDGSGCELVATHHVTNFPRLEVTLEGDPFICDGESTVLKANAGMATYKWSTGSTAAEITIDEPREYSVTITNANGCTDEKTFEVQGLVAPEINIDPELKFCIGASLTLDLTGDYAEYLWSNGDTLPSTTISEPGDYSLMVVGDNGCSASAAFSVSTYVEPQPVFVGETKFCPGESTTISIEDTWYSILWSNGDTQASVVLSEETTLIVTVADASGCVGQGSITVAPFDTIHPSIVGPAEVCPDEVFSLKAGETYPSYEWSVAGATSQEVFPDTVGLFSLTVRDDNGCFVTADWEVRELPRPDVVVTGDTLFCEGTSATLTAISADANTVFWPFNQSNNASVDVEQEGWYSAMATSSNGCTQATSIFVRKLPLPEIQTSALAVIDCTKETVTLGSADMDPNRYTFEWTGESIDDANRFLPQPIVGDTGWYSLVIVDTQTGCQSPSASVRVDDIRFTPRIDFEGVPEIDCDHPTVTIRDANPFNANFDYKWYNEARDPISGNNRSEITTGTPGLYFLEVLDQSSGCNTRDSIRITQDQAFPQVSSTANGPITCDNPTTKIIGTIANTLPSQEVTWEIITGALETTTDNLSAIATSPGTYVLFVENTTNGCVASDTIVILENIIPPPAMAGPDQTLDCESKEASLVAQVAENRQLSYAWIHPNGSIVDGEQLTASQTGTYTLRVQDPENGCIALDEVEVLLDENQPIGMEINIEHPDCKGETDGFIRINKVEGSEGPFIFEFNGGGYKDVREFSNIAPGSYEISVQNVAGCTYTTEVRVNDGREITINLGEDQEVERGAEVVIKPEMSIPLDEIGSLIITNNEGSSCGDCFESWTFIPESSGVYVAKLVDENGCKAEDRVRITIRIPNKIYIPNTFSPNDDGNNDWFTIFSNGDVKMVNSLKIFDRWGDMLFENGNFLPNILSEGWDGKFKQKPVNTGVYVYFVELELSDGTVIRDSGDVTVVW
ncbi:MAG: gliding motility-associated C-terminal domain-containing protein [Saprospiraceae bacterium]